MSIYNQDTNICPDLNLSAPQETQAYRLKKITEIEAFFVDEIEARRQEEKKKKPLNTIIGILDTGLIILAVIAGGASIPAFASGAGLPVGATLGGLGVVLSLLTVATQKFFKILTVKQGKHDAIMLLAQSKLDSIADIISQAMQDGDISPICLETEPRPSLKQIEKEQREEILEQGKKEGK